MKNLVIKTFSLFMGLSPAAAFCQKGFVADLLNVKGGNAIIYRVHSDGTRYRYDFEENGMQGIVIVDPARGKTAILMPDRKFVHYTEITSQISMANDPFQAFLSMRKRYTAKITGTEKINGYIGERSEICSGDKKLYTAWYSDELGFILKMVNNDDPGTYLELSAIKPGEIDPSVFIIPGDYTVVDQRMRPVVAEVPPPEKWNRIETLLPLSGEFSSGDIISFNIAEESNYKVVLKNSSTGPAKTVRRTIRNGSELPDNEQGPLKWRTTRLIGDESSSNTYAWKPGDTIIIEVHEGKIAVEIMVEK